MIKWVRGIFDRLFVVAGALVLSQAPLYMQQYTQELSGHTAELHYQVQKLEAAAAESNKSLNEYMLKFTANQDPDFARQGLVMQGMVERSRAFSDALNTLQNSSLLAKPVFFIAHFNSEVAAATWKSFEYGISFSVEGLCYAVFGALIGYAAFAIIALLINGIGRLFAAKKVPLAP